MNSKDIWNIVIKVNKKVIKINVSVFFFIFIPYVYYLDKGNSNLYINFFKNYVLLFVLYTAYKVVYNFLTKKNSYIYPFGVFTNNNFNLKVFNNSDSGIISKSHTINLTNLAILSFDIIFLSCFAFCYYINNFSYEVISYPIILLLTSIFAKDLFNNEGLKQNKKIYILIFYLLPPKCPVPLLFDGKCPCVTLVELLLEPKPDGLLLFDGGLLKSGLRFTGGRC